MRFTLALATFGIGCAAVACTRGEVAPDGGVPPAPRTETSAAAEPAGAVARLDAHRWLGPPVVSVNLTVWPVVTDAPRDLGEYLTLDEAEKRGVAKVTEIGGAGAAEDGRAAQTVQVVVEDVPSRGEPVQQRGEAAAQTLQSADVGAAEVNALVVENTGDVPLLICAGTVVRGGKQDRQVGEDVVVAARSKRRVDVFCVEQGRWETNREGVSTNALFGASGVVASKSVRQSAQYMKSQQAVWKEVAAVPGADDEIAQSASVGGRTTYLRNVENASKETTEARAKTSGEVRAHFAAVKGGGSHVVGFAYAVNGKPVNVRTFAAPRVFEGQFEPFLQAMVIDAESARAEGPGPAARAGDVVLLVESIRKGTATDEGRAGYRLRVLKADSGFNSNCYAVRDGAAPEAAFPGEDVPITEDWTAR